MRFQIAVIVLAIGLALAPIPPSSVERYYSSLIFPPWQRTVTAVSNLVPFALLDVLLVAAVAWFVVEVARAVIRGRAVGWRRVAAPFLARVATMTAVLYIAFLVSWGLNYRRLSLIQKVKYEPSAVSADGARQLAIASVTEVNALYESAHAVLLESAVVDPSLAAAFARAQQAVGIERAARPGRPKWTILDVYFRAAGVEGMTDPFFLESLITGDLLPFERPFVVAHEWSHLAGLADEGEANFVGWLTCTKGSEAARYSGWLFLYSQVSAALKDAERAEVGARLGPGPRADLRAVAERVRRHLKPVIADAGWRVYDRYLKANRVEAGTASYAEVVRLVLGVRLEPA